MHSRVKRSLLIVLIVWILCQLGCISCSRNAEFIEDQAGLLTESETKRIVALNSKLLHDLDIHIKVDILRDSPHDIDDESSRIFKKHSLGYKTGGAKGVLFLIDPKGKQVRVEIGYDLEHMYPDGFVGYIERNQMAPFFQSGKVGPGIEATIELLVARAFGRIDVSRYKTDEEPMTDKQFSGGAGARTAVEIGSNKSLKPSFPAAKEFGAQTSPEAALEMYKNVLRLRIKDPNLGLYTPETREFFNNHLVTDAQQDNELRTLEQMPPYMVAVSGSLAVLRFPIQNRQYSPYLLRRGDDGWMLDFASMMKLVGFNHLNEWFFRMKGHEFMFAFEDLYFDKHGFPHLKK